MIEKIQRILGTQQVRKSAGRVGRTSDAACDGVEVSDFARELARASAELKALPAVRQEKVDAVREQIASGTYEMKLSLTARRLVEAGILRGEEKS